MLVTISASFEAVVPASPLPSSIAETTVATISLVSCTTAVLRERFDLEKE